MNYLIFCVPRSGSTLITEALNSHSDATNAGEIFNAKNTIHYEWRDDMFRQHLNKSASELFIKVETFKLKEILLDSINYDFNFLIDSVYEKFHGMKIISTQLSNKGLQNFLNRKLKFILLERDLKEACESFNLIKHTKVWHTKELINVPNIVVSNEELEIFEKNYFVAYEKFKNQIISNNEDFIVVNYKEVFQWNVLCQKLCSFLNIENTIFPMIYKKINNKKTKKLL